MRIIRCLGPRFIYAGVFEICNCPPSSILVRLSYCNLQLLLVRPQIHTQIHQMNGPGVLWQCSLHFPSSSFVFACCAVCGCCVYQREENSNYLRLFSRAHLINNQAVIIPYTERSGIWHLRGGSNYWNLNITRGTRHKESMFLFCRAVWEIKHRDKTKTGNKNTAWNRRLHTLKIFVVRF